MTEPVRVAHVITRLDVGGAQETVVRIAGGLDRSRYEPLIIHGPGLGSGGSLVGRAREAGVEVIEVPSIVGPIRPWSDIRAVGAVSRLLRTRGVGLVHTHSSKAGVIGRVAARSVGVPVVHMVHGWSFNDDQPRLERSLFIGVERILAAIATDVLSVVTGADRSTGLRHKIGTRSMYRLVRSGIVLLGPPSTDLRTIVRSDLGMSDGSYVVVSVGRLEAQKDPLTLVRAFGLAFREDPEVTLALIGGGALRDDVIAAAADAGVGGQVVVLGLRPDARRLLSAADAFVLSSRWEGLPRAVLEAMDSGIPVIATDVGGVAEVVRNGETGLLVPPQSPARLASAMLELRGNPERGAAFAAAAAARLPEFSEAHMLEQVHAVYDEILAEGQEGR